MQNLGGQIKRDVNTMNAKQNAIHNAYDNFFENLRSHREHNNCTSEYVYLIESWYNQRLLGTFYYCEDELTQYNNDFRQLNSYYRQAIDNEPFARFKNHSESSPYRQKKIRNPNYGQQGSVDSTTRSNQIATIEGQAQGSTNSNDNFDNMTAAALNAIDRNEANRSRVENFNVSKQTYENNKGNVQVNSTASNSDLLNWRKKNKSGQSSEHTDSIGEYQGQVVSKKGDTIIVAANNKKYLLQKQSMDEGYSHLLDEYNIPKGTFVIDTDIQGGKEVIGYVTTQGYSTNSMLMDVQNEYAQNSTGFRFYEKLEEIGQYKTSKVYFRRSTQTIHIGEDQYLLSQQKLPSDLKLGGLPEGNNIKIVCIKENSQSFSYDDIIGYATITGNQCTFTEINRNGCSELKFQEDLKNLNMSTLEPNSYNTANLVDAVCETALREHLKKNPLTLFKFFATESTIAEETEQAILRIMNCLDPKDYSGFLKYLDENNEVLKNLISKMDDVSINPSDGNNYTGFMYELLKIFKNYYTNAINTVNVNWDRVFFITPVTFKPDFQSESIYTNYYYTTIVDRGEYLSTGNIRITEIQSKRHIVRNVNKGGNINVDYQETVLAELKPLEPVIINLETNLPLIQTATEDITSDGEEILVPAIFFKYYNDKKRNDDIRVTTKIGIDILGLIGPGTQLLQAANYGRKALALVQFLSSTSDILEDSGIKTSNDPKIEKMIGGFKDLIGILGLYLNGNDVVRRIDMKQRFPTETLARHMVLINKSRLGTVKDEVLFYAGEYMDKQSNGSDKK